MKLSDIKIGGLYVLRAGVGAVIYKVCEINGMSVLIKDASSPMSSPQNVDYSLLREPTVQQMTN